MHEMGIAMQILEIAKSSIPEELKEEPVEFLNLRVGKLSAVVPSSLTFCFEIITKDTLFEGAVLKIEEVPVTARCRKCSTEWTPDSPAFSCPQCEDTDIEMLSGRELEIVSIEIKD